MTPKGFTKYAEGRYEGKLAGVRVRLLRHPASVDQKSQSGVWWTVKLGANRTLSSKRSMSETLLSAKRIIEADKRDGLLP